MKTLLKLAVILIMLGLYMFEASKMFTAHTSVQSSVLYPLIIVFFSFIIIIATKKRFVREINTLILFNIIIYLSALLHSISVPFTSRALYITFLLPLFCLLLSSTIAKEKTLRQLFLNGILVVYLLLTLFYYKNYQNNIFIDIESQSNSAYTLLYFTPILLCHEKKIIRYLVLILTGLALIFSLKRSGLISFALATVVYFYISVFIINKKKNKLLLICLLTLGILFSLSIVQYYFSDRTEILIKRFEDLGSEGGSGRDIIYQSTWDMIAKNDILSTLVGHGYNSVARDSVFKLSAHNDYLEIMYDYGMFALLCLLIYIVQFFRYIIILIRKQSEYAATVAFTLSIILINSNFSHIFFYDWYFMLISLFWGYVVSLEHDSQTLSSQKTGVIIS